MKKADINWKEVPDAPGVYQFKTEEGKALYVGKATSLRDRIKSYFANDIADVRSPLIEKVVRDAFSVSVEETDSVLEALILEAKLIKKLLPPGNTDQKDNKSFAYLVVTKERYPRFLVVRERELSATFPPSKIKKLFGPFLSAAQLREALKIVRKIFPFFDTPFPITSSLTPAQAKHVTFNQSIGLYPSDMDENAYVKTVKYVCELFDGKKRSLVQSLKRAMAHAAKGERFEEAEILKRQVFALEHIRDVTLIKEEYRTPETASFRIEAYDIAHIRGDATRGVMTVVIDGELESKEYRTFTIRKAKAGDDIAALSEVIERRAKHREWQYPQVVVIDGGATHLKHAKAFLKLAGMGDAEVVSVVKDERHKPKNILGAPTVRNVHESSILLANAEAHRFAINRHRRALRKRM
ncbi:GIY-YIG nuclease family protein [Patescibacteria group bacterium]|nr:GIY-YIG nuclease family protein [Patescibacteria group bacterium]